MSNRAKYETLALSVLKDLAKARGFKGITGLKKADIVEAMVRKDEEEAMPVEKAVVNTSGKPAESKPDRTMNELPEKEKQSDLDISDEKKSLDSGIEASGILEVLTDGYGFIRSENYLPG